MSNRRKLGGSAVARPTTDAANTSGSVSGAVAEVSVVNSVTVTIAANPVGSSSTGTLVRATRSTRSPLPRLRITAGKTIQQTTSVTTGPAVPFAVASANRDDPAAEDELARGGRRGREDLDLRLLARVGEVHAGSGGAEDGEAAARELLHRRARRAADALDRSEGVREWVRADGEEPRPGVADLHACRQVPDVDASVARPVELIRLPAPRAGPVDGVRRRSRELA